MSKLAPWIVMLMVGCGGSGSQGGDGGGGNIVDGSATGDNLDGGSQLQDFGLVHTSDDAGTTTLSSAVQIIVEPSDKGAALLDAIKAATISIHMTMYLLTDSDTIKALIAKKAITKLVLNQNFPDTSTSNQSVYTQLKSAGVNVVWASSAYTYTHEKCVILDGKTAWIMTMNATNSSPTANREYLAIDTQASDVAEAETIFEADFAGVSSPATDPLVVSPTNSRPDLLAFIATATQTIDLEVEELSDYKVTDALAAKQDAGVQVHITLANGTPSASQMASITEFKQHGIVVKSLASPYLHAKAIVIDGKTAFVGSENFTTNSLLYNRELGVFFGIASEVQKVYTQITADFTAGTAL